MEDYSLSSTRDLVIEYIDNNITVAEDPDGSREYSLKPVAFSISVFDADARTDGNLFDNKNKK